MNNPRDIQIQEYDYALPDTRIAKYPMQKRDESKLLIYNKGEIHHVPEYRQILTQWQPHGI